MLDSNTADVIVCKSEPALCFARSIPSYLAKRVRPHAGRG